jgi:hypothetical protein
MQREPHRTMTALMGENAGDPGEDAFGRIVENAIRNGRLTAAEILELRSVIAAAFQLDPLEDAPASDIDWRQTEAAPPVTRLH